MLQDEKTKKIKEKSSKKKNSPTEKQIFRLKEPRDCIAVKFHKHWGKIKFYKLPERKIKKREWNIRGRKKEKKKFLIKYEESK